MERPHVPDVPPEPTRHPARRRPGHPQRRARPVPPPQAARPKAPGEDRKALAPIPDPGLPLPLELAGQPAGLAGGEWKGGASIESNAINPADFREAQHRHWDSAAVGWKEWSEFNDSADRHISERLVELADVQSGSRVLDIAAGYGEPALTAARKAGPEGRVVATDISAEMLAFGGERAGAAGLDNVEFMESDASSLDFPQESFDAAVSRWGIIFEPDAEAAAQRIRASS